MLAVADKKLPIELSTTVIGYFSSPYNVGGDSTFCLRLLVLALNSDTDPLYFVP